MWWLPNNSPVGRQTRPELILRSRSSPRRWKKRERRLPAAEGPGRAPRDSGPVRGPSPCGRRPWEREGGRRAGTAMLPPRAGLRRCGAPSRWRYGQRRERPRSYEIPALSPALSIPPAVPWNLPGRPGTAALDWCRQRWCGTATFTGSYELGRPTRGAVQMHQAGCVSKEPTVRM